MMAAMLKPVTVWAVELGGESRGTEIRGTLSLQDGALEFNPRDELERGMLISLVEVSSVRRLRGSPVLMVVHGSEPTPTRTAFYFAQPPPLAAFRGEDRPTPTPLGFGSFRSPKRRARRQNANYLGVLNREKKAVLIEWDRAVKAAVAAARG